VSSGTALTLAVRGGRVIEQVDDVQSLDVGALLARLVGSVQELSAQLHSKDAQIAVLAKQNQELGLTASRRSRWRRRSSENVGKNHIRC